MKLLMLLLCLLFNHSYSYAQSDKNFDNSDEMIKKTRVKSMSSYYIQNRTDSNLTMISTYDSLGGIVISKMFDRYSNLTSIDSFFYDKNHYLVKRINTDGHQIRDVTVNTNDSSGKLLSYVNYYSNSIQFRGRIFYDENGRFIKSIYYPSKGDTTFLNSYYNQKGFLIKSSVVDKQNGSTVFSSVLDSLGKILNKTRISPDSKTIWEFKYDSYGRNYETKSITTSKNKKEFNALKYSYYPNGLISEKLWSLNNKIISFETAYYTYY